MPLLPSDWNVVVLGGWNPAILTPKGILGRIFQKTDIPVSIQVAMDELAPVKVGHDGLVVAVTNNLLRIDVENRIDAELEKAIALARRAMEILPETPLKAAGFNINYRTEKNCNDELIQPLISALNHPLDTVFEQNELPIRLREIDRKFAWNGGTIVFFLIRDHEDCIQFSFNFERKGTRKEMIEWLGMPIGDARAQLAKILFGCFGLSSEAIK